MFCDMLLVPLRGRKKFQYFHLIYREIYFIRFIVPSVLLQWFIKCLFKLFLNNKFRNFEGAVSILADAVEPCVKKTRFLNKSLV